MGSSVLIDMTGQRFGRWTVIERAENRGSRVFWTCKCDCGEMKDVSGKSLRYGDSKSCGCLRRENKGRPAGGYRTVKTDRVKAACARCGCTIYTAPNATAVQYCSTCRRLAKKIPTPHDALNNPDISKCRSCKYREYYNSTTENKQYYGCQYLNMTGEMRPCKPGKDCTAYEKRGKRSGT